MDYKYEAEQVRNTQVKYKYLIIVLKCSTCICYLWFLVEFQVFGVCNDGSGGVFSVIKLMNILVCVFLQDGPVSALSVGTPAEIKLSMCRPSGRLPLRHHTHQMCDVLLLAEMTPQRFFLFDSTVRVV